MGSNWWPWTKRLTRLIETKTKQCRNCKAIKPLNGFYNKWDSADKKQSICKSCNKTQLSAYALYARKARLKRVYGEGHSSVLEGGQCHICQDTFKTLVVDHDHATGNVRGYLCRRCNVLLGMAKDNTRILLNSIKYLVNYIELSVKTNKSNA